MPKYEVRMPVVGYVVEIVENVEDEDAAINEILNHGVCIHNLDMLYTYEKCTAYIFDKIEDYDAEAIEIDNNGDEIYEKAYDIVKRFNESESNIANIAKDAIELCRKIVDSHK